MKNYSETIGQVFLRPVEQAEALIVDGVVKSPIYSVVGFLRRQDIPYV